MSHAALYRAVGLATVTLLLAPAANSFVPLGLELPPGGRRCVHEHVDAGEQGIVDLFVERGGRLMVHLTVEGPMTSGWDGIPETSKDTENIFDEVVTNSGAEQFADSFTLKFESKGGAYQVCVANDMNKVTPKEVQLSIRQKGKAKAKAAASEKLAKPENPNLSEEDKAAAEKKEQEVSSLESSIKKLKAGLRKLREQQMQERHRQATHTAVNQDSNNHMVVGSLIETVVFIGTASFQIIFVRHWFEGKGSQQWA